MPTSRFSAYLNAALYHNRFGDFVIESAGGDTVLTGNRLPISPDEVWNAGLTLTRLGPIDIALDAKYVGDVMVDQRNTLEIDPYALVDAAVTWRHDWLALTLSAHNLFDEEYFGTGDSSTAETVDVGAPRQVLLTARIDLRRR